MSVEATLAEIGRIADTYGLSLVAVGIRSVDFHASDRLPGPKYVGARIRIDDCLEPAYFMEALGRGLAEMRKLRSEGSRP